MTRRPTPDDLTQRVDELQARLAAIEQASGASGAAAPERTTRRDMFRRAGITAAGVVGGAAGLSLLNAQVVHATSGSPVFQGEVNTASGTGAQTTTVLTTGTSSLALAAFGGATGAIGSGSVGLKGVTSTSGSGSTGLLGEAGSGYGVRGTATGSGVPVFGEGSGFGLGVLGTVTTAGSSGAGVVGVGAFAGVIGSGQVPTGTGTGTGTGIAPAPDFIGFGSGRIAQIAQSGPPNFASLGIGAEEQTRDTDGVLWLSDGDGSWIPAAVGGINQALFTREITTQPTLSNSDGKTWQVIDSGLNFTLTPTFNAQAVIRLTAAAWTGFANYNQDLGIVVGTSAYSPSTNTPNGWTESGGPASFSPNGACAETIVPLMADVTYYFTAVWKANVAPGAGGRAASSEIFLGAGPLIDGSFSPTRLLVRLVTDSAANVVTKKPAGKTAHKSSVRKSRKAWTPIAKRKVSARRHATKHALPRTSVKSSKTSKTRTKA